MYLSSCYKIFSRRSRFMHSMSSPVELGRYSRAPRTISPMSMEVVKVPGYPARRKETIARRTASGKGSASRAWKRRNIKPTAMGLNWHTCLSKLMRSASGRLSQLIALVLYHPSMGLVRAIVHGQAKKLIATERFRALRLITEVKAFA